MDSLWAGQSEFRSVAVGKRFSLLFRSQSSLLLNEYRFSFAGINLPAFDAGYYHQLPRLGMSGAIPLLLYAFMAWTENIF
jgi:hypothetical protein